MDAKKTLTARITKEQKLILLEFMRANRALGCGQLSGPNSSRRQRNLWLQVATKLNASGGAQKNGSQWRRCWIDWKGAVKRQYKAHKKFNPNKKNVSLELVPKPIDYINQGVVEFFSSHASDEDDNATKTDFQNADETYYADIKDEFQEEEVEFSDELPCTSFTALNQSYLPPELDEKPLDSDCPTVVEIFSQHTSDGDGNTTEIGFRNDDDMYCDDIKEEIIEEKEDCSVEVPSTASTAKRKDVSANPQNKNSHKSEMKRLEKFMTERYNKLENKLDCFIAEQQKTNALLTQLINEIKKR